MSLSKEWFEERDQFIAQQKELGSFTLKESLEELDVTMPFFFDLGILSQRDFTATTTNLTQLTALGELFYVDKYQLMLLIHSASFGIQLFRTTFAAICMS